MPASASSTAPPDGGIVQCPAPHDGDGNDRDVVGRRQEQEAHPEQKQRAEKQRQPEKQQRKLSWLDRRRSIEWAGNRCVVFDDVSCDDVNGVDGAAAAAEEDEPGTSAKEAAADTEREGNEEASNEGDEEDHDKIPPPTAVKIHPLPESPWHRTLTLRTVPPTLSQIQSWDFDVLSYAPTALIPAVAQMFAYYDLLTLYRIEEETFTRFLGEVMERHNPHEYHNWHHAVSCTHVSFLLVSKSGGDAYLTSPDIFALLFGALVHDVDHAGNNNDFEVKTGTDRAQRYGNENVLERHSVYVTFDEILKVEGCDVLGGMEENVREQVREMAADVVIATDPAGHGELLKRMSSLAEEVRKQEREDQQMEEERTGKQAPFAPWDRDDPESRALLCHMIVHAADISNPVHERFDVVRDWCHRISTEFAHQADMERQLGMDVAPFMDGLDDEYRVAKLQIGFYNFMANPFFRVVGLLLPEAAHLPRRGEVNMGRYQDIVDYVDGSRKNKTKA